MDHRKLRKNDRGFITFPTKFDAVEPLLPLDHKDASSSDERESPAHHTENRVGHIAAGGANQALNRMCAQGTGRYSHRAGGAYGWLEVHVCALAERLSDELSAEVKKQLFIEIIFMTYSYVHRAINREAFPGAIELYDPALMTGRGRGKYCYRDSVRAEGEAFLRALLSEKLSGVPIAYVV